MNKLALLVISHRKTLKTPSPKFRITSLHVAKQLDLSFPIAGGLGGFFLC